MRRLTSLISIVCLLIGLSGFSPTINEVLFSNRPATSGGFTPTCSQSGNFLARSPASGLNDANKALYDTFICYLVNNPVGTPVITGTMAGSGLGATGCGSNIDFMYILAGPSSPANVQLMNLCSTGFTLTTTGSPTFNATFGYTAPTTSDFLNTGYDPSTGSAYTSTAASMGAWVYTGDTNANAGFGGHVTGSTGDNHIAFRDGSGNLIVRINTGFGTGGFAVSANPVGLMGGSLSGTTETVYFNSTSLGTNTYTSGAPAAQVVSILRSTGAISDTTHGLSGAFYGGTLSSSQWTAVCHAYNVFLHSMNGTASGIC